LQRQINTDNIGIIAGGGQFPLLFIDAAKKAGQDCLVLKRQ